MEKRLGGGLGQHTAPERYEKKELVEKAEETGNDELLEAEFVVKANQRFHILAEKKLEKNTANKTLTGSLLDGKNGWNIRCKSYVWIKYDKTAGGRKIKWMMKKRTV